MYNINKVIQYIYIGGDIMDFNAVVEFGIYLDQIKKSTMEKHKVERSKEEMELFESSDFWKGRISKYIAPLEYKEIPDEEYTSNLKLINATFQEAYKKHDFDTFSLMFVEYCNFCYIYGTSCENVIDIAISFISNETERRFLSALGTAILMQGKDTKKQLEEHLYAQEIYPTNQAFLLYDFVINLFMYSRTFNKKELTNEIEENRQDYLRDMSIEYSQLCPKLQKAVFNNHTSYIPYVRISADSIEYEDEEYDDSYSENEKTDSIDNIAYRKSVLMLPIDISTKTKELIQELMILTNDITNKNHKLSALQQEKKDLIDYHRHNWKHIVYPSIVESVAQELLAAGDEDKANKLFSAYNSEMLLKNDLKLLALEYENNPSEQITLMKDSMLLQSARGSKAKTISSIFCNALDNVVFRIVMEKVDTSNEIVDVQNYLAAKQYDMTSIRESYIENFMGNNCKPKDGQEILTWFSENFFRVRLMFEDNADSWGKLKFKAGDTSWTKFAEIFINLINNALKYGKDYLDVTFGKCGRNGSEFFTITMTNPIDPAPGDQEGEHKGLTYIDKFFRSINTAACNEELGIEIGKENNVFSVTIFITDKVF